MAAPLFYAQGGTVGLSTDDQKILSSSSYETYTASGGRRTREQAHHRRSALKRQGHAIPEWNKQPAYLLEPEPEPTPITQTDDEPDDWETYFDEMEQASLTYQGIHSDDSRTFSIDAQEMLPIALVCAGDFHFGNKGVRYDLINRDLDLIQKTDGCHVVGMGDYVDNFKTNGKASSGIYGAAEPNPEYQEAWAVIRMRRTTKWAALIDGNHDDRNYQTAGLSSSTIAIANQLNVPAFTQAGAGCRITVGVESYFGIMKHNFRGNSGISKGNEARRMWDEWPWHWENADFVCLAHTHEPHVEIPQRKGQPVVYARSGTYKEADGYAEMKGYKSGYGPSFFVLYPDKHLVLPLPQQALTENIEIFKGIRARYET